MKKTNIFENYFHTLQKTKPPPPQYSVVEHVSHWSDYCDACCNNTVTGGRGLYTYK